MQTIEITPATVRDWLEHLANYGVIPHELKVHVVFLAVAYLRATETEPMMFDPLDYMLRAEKKGSSHA